MNKSPILEPAAEPFATREAVWSRPAGLREALVTAVPLVVSTLSWTVMNFIDRLFLFEFDPEAGAAALPAGIMAFTVICFPLGVASYASTFVAQYHGAGRRRQVGAVVWQAAWIGAVSVPWALAAIPFAPQMFAAAGNPPTVAALEVEYFYTLSFSGGAHVLSAALSAFFTGRGNVRTVMIVDSIAAGLNVALDYAWIFGHWGFPEAGIAGAGWATTVALWVKTAIYWALFLRRRERAEFATWTSRRLDVALLRRLFRYGLPNGLQMLLEVAAFGLFTLLVGRLGSLALAATSLAFNVNNFAFMPIWGVGLAASTMVGRRLGEDRPELAVRSTWSCLVWGLAYMGILCVLYVALPDVVLAAHQDLLDRSPGLREHTLTLFCFLAAFGLFDAVSMVVIGALKGAGDVRFVLFASVAIAAVSVAATYLGLRQGWALYWCWSVLTAWVVALAATFTWRFLCGPWQSMRVIEPAEH